MVSSKHSPPAAPRGLILKRTEAPRAAAGDRGPPRPGSLSRVQVFVIARPPPRPRLLCLWTFPGQNTRVGCYFLLQEIFPI